MEQTKGPRTTREFQVAAVIYITNVTQKCASTFIYSRYLGHKSFESGLSFRRFNTPYVLYPGKWRMLTANNDLGQWSDLQEAILDAASFLAYVASSEEDLLRM